MLLNNFFAIIFLLGIGQWIKKSDLFPDETAAVLNSFLLNISLPAIIIVSLSQFKLSLDAMVPFIVHWSAFSLHFALFYLLRKFIKMENSLFYTLVIVSTLGNTAFLGIPLLQTFYGDKAISYAILYDQLGSGLGFILIGAFYIPKIKGERTRTMKSVVYSLLRFPAFIGLIIGLTTQFTGLNNTLFYALDMTSKTLIPIAMIVVGAQMNLKVSSHIFRPLGLGLTLKLIVMPMIVLATTLLLGVDKNLALKCSILQSGMPPMVTAGAMAINEGFDKELSASLVGYGLLLAFVTLSLINFLLS